jgi:hypothetical protein
MASSKDCVGKLRSLRNKDNLSGVGAGRGFLSSGVERCSRYRAAIKGKITTLNG